MAVLDHSRTLAVLRRADELAGAVHVLWTGGASLVPGAGPAQPAGTHLLGPDAATSRALAAFAALIPPLSLAALRRPDLRQEPSAVVSHAGLPPDPTSR